MPAGDAPPVEVKPVETKPAAKKPDRLFLPHAKDAIPIRPSSAEMFVLQQLRDEAHRFAVSFHRGQRRRFTLRSSLSSITGIGPTRQRLLLRHFGSLKRVREAPAGELAAIPGMTRSAAEAVVAYFAGQPLPASPEANVTPHNDAEKYSEELAIDDAFADVPEGPRPDATAPPPPAALEEKKHEI